MHLMEANSVSTAGTPQTLRATSLQLHLMCILVPDEHTSILGVETLDVLTYLEVDLQVYLKEGQIAEAFGAPCKPITTAVLVVPPDTKVDGK